MARPRAIKPKRLKTAGRGGLANIRPQSNSDYTQNYQRQSGYMPDVDLEALVRKLGNEQKDRRLAERVLKLQQELPNATIPELIAYDYLERVNARFIYQQPFFGGRSVKGGFVADFWIDKGSIGIVWMIQGDYFHSQLIQSGQDAAAKAMMLGAWVNSVQTKYVVEIWENKCYTNRPKVFELGYEGIEIGK